MDKAGDDEGEQGGTHRCQQISDISNPEYRAAEQNIAQRAAAQCGDQGNDDNPEQIDRLAPGFKHSGDGKDGDCQQSEFVCHCKDTGAAQVFMVDPRDNLRRQRPASADRG